MHYYKRNIGDYHKKAGRLSMLQHGAFNLLIDSCYDRERFPTLSEAIDWTWASNEAEVAAVTFVLSKFFEKRGEIYVQPRIEEELAGYVTKAETNKRIADEREAKRREEKQGVPKKARTVDEPLQESNEPPPNHKPLTNNHKPLTNNINNNSASAIFEIFLGWVPRKVLAAVLEKRNIPIKRHSQRTLKKFIEHGMAAKTTNTQDGWESLYADWLEREFDKPEKPESTPAAKKSGEKMYLGVPASTIECEARVGESYEDCAARLKRMGML